MNNSDRVYKSILQDKLNKINKQIIELEKRNTGLRLLTDQTTTKIESLRLQAAQIQEEIAQFTERQEINAMGDTVVETFDEIVGFHDEKRQTAEATLAELQQLKSQLTTKRAIRKIEKKISHQQQILQKLRKSDTRISGIQKAIMYPKAYREMKKNQILAKAEAKVNVAEANVQDMEALQAMLDPESSIKDSILNTVYEIKKAHYLRKADRANQVLEQMKQSKGIIGMKGAKAVVITKNLKNKLNNKLRMDQVQQVQVAADPNQMTPAVASR